MTTNPFADREPFKKRIISASLTHEQRLAFDRLKERTGADSDGALIKKALSEMLDRYETDERGTEPWPPATVA